MTLFTVDVLDSMQNDPLVLLYEHEVVLHDENTGVIVLGRHGHTVATTQDKVHHTEEAAVHQGIVKLRESLERVRERYARAIEKLESRLQKPVEAV